MRRTKNTFAILIFFFFFLAIVPAVLADREYQIAKIMQETEAQSFSYEYIKDLRKKISEEKYEAIPKIGEKFALRQSGTLKNETAYRVSSPRQFTKIKNQLILSEAGKISDALSFKLSGRFYYDAVFNLTHSFPANVKSDQRSELELRDTFIDYSYGPWDIRLGKQQIVWGEAVALFFADVVNAKDLREFILPDFDLIRIPEWASDIEYSKENFHAEFVWLPAPQFNKLGVTNAEFAFPYPIPTPTTAFTTKDASRPKNALDNSELGIRLSCLLSGWDIGAFYLHTWDKSPVNFRSIQSGVFNFFPQYKRLEIIGATLAKEIKEAVLKGEFVFNKDSYFSIFDNTDIDGVVRRNFIDYLLGLDYTFFDKVDTNLQFMQRAIFNHTNLLADNENKFNNSLSFRIKTDFLNGKLEPEFLIIASLMEPDFLYRPKISLKIKNNWRLRFGADIFQGDASGLFGRFDKKSRIYSEVIYDF